MNIETEKTCACIEQIAAQATLMTGLNQFSPAADAEAERKLEESIAYERLHGNKRLLRIYGDALEELRRRK